MRIFVAAAAVASAALLFAATATRSPEIPFQRHAVDLGIPESCTVADFNNDGRPDIFAGDSWYENPTWKKHYVRPVQEYGTYTASLTDLALDVDGDGKMDVISSGWHSQKIWWSRNPGKPGAQWEDHTIDSGFPVEFAFLVDLDNDGKANELLPQFGGNKAYTAWYERKDGRMVKHIISAKSYGHGIGAGDVNKDGRVDILTNQGWLEAPADPRQADWPFHPDWKIGNSSFIFVIDLNEDGRPDLLSAMAHDYGIFWVENKADGTWEKKPIDASWSQGHALTLTDINRDGRKDLVTGKRWMAHDGKDPGEHDPLGLYWYEYRPDGKGGVAFSRHVVDYGGRAGAGMHIPVVDMDKDGDLDFVVAGKSGLFLFENLTRRGTAVTQRSTSATASASASASH
jgi:hypothetical protein